MFVGKSCSFVGKIMSVFGIIPVSLWEKFGEQSMVLNNSCQFVGKITGLFTSICRGTASHNVFDGKFAET